METPPGQAVTASPSRRAGPALGVVARCWRAVPGGRTRAAQAAKPGSGGGLYPLAVPAAPRMSSPPGGLVWCRRFTREAFGKAFRHCLRNGS